MENREIASHTAQMERLTKVRRSVSERAGFSCRHFFLFVLCASLFFSSVFYRTSTAVIASEFQKDLSLSPEQLGILSASFFYAFAIAQVPLALFIDRLGARSIMTALTLAGSAGALIFGMAGGFKSAIIGRTLIGFGMAANLMGGLKLFTRWFSPRQFATLSGLLVGSGTFGSIAASTPLALLASFIGWRFSFICIGLFTAALALLFYATVRETPHVSGDFGPEVRESLKTSLGVRLKTLFINRDYWLISCGSFFRYGTMMAIQGLWAGPYLIQCFNFSPVRTGNILATVTIGYVAGSSGGGWLSDRVLRSRKYVVIIGLSGMTATIACLTWSIGQHSPIFQVFTFFSLGLFPGICNVVYAHIKGVMPAEMAGMALTGINFFTVLGAGAYIHLMGWVLECVPPEKQSGLQGFETAFFPGLIGMAAATALYLLTRESKEFSRR